jgi:ribonucleoside-diphosphate reductase alpha chain
MEMEASASRDFREATAQSVRVERDHHVPAADTAGRLGSELLGPPAANRHRLPDERPAITHHFSVGGHEGYLTVGLYPDGQPGEIFIRMAKEGSTIAGLMECFGTVVSVSLQHGVPLRVLCDKLSHTRFEPSGWTGSAELGYAKSIMDYLFRWLELRFLSGTQLALFSAPGSHGTFPAYSGRLYRFRRKQFSLVMGQRVARAARS